jgi:hypothetical protein
MTLKDAALGSGALETDEDVARYEAILFGKFWLTKWMSEVSSPLPVWIEAWTMWVMDQCLTHLFQIFVCRLG